MWFLMIHMWTDCWIFISVKITFSNINYVVILRSLPNKSNKTLDAKLFRLEHCYFITIARIDRNNMSDIFDRLVSSETTAHNSISGIIWFRNVLMCTTYFQLLIDTNFNFSEFIIWIFPSELLGFKLTSIDFFGVS